MTEARRDRDAPSDEQAHVAKWFDATYAERAFRYLRPLAAYPIFVQLLGAERGDALLDVACGPGHLLKAATLRGLEPTGVDISENALRIAAEYVPGARTEVGNAEQLPFADATFDHVTCVGAIERFLDRQRALAEMHRVGKPGARYCFMVRNADTLMWRLWHRRFGMQNRAGHQDALDLESWRALFASCGFEVRGVFMDQWMRQRLRAAWRGFRPRVPRVAERVATPLIPIRFVNEFIFVLAKSEAAG